jgi:sugar phosphate isomerase/epimerase
VILLSTGTLYTWGLSRTFRAAADVGFHGMEVLIDNRPDTYDPRYLAGLQEEYKLPIKVLHSPFVKVKSWKTGPVGSLKKTVALARSLGISTVVTHPPFKLKDIAVLFRGAVHGKVRVLLPWPVKDASYRFFAEGGIHKLEQEAGVAIAVENMPRRTYLGIPIPLFWFNTPEKLNRFDHLTMDTTHVGTWGDDLLEYYRRIREHIRHIHISNFNGKEHRSIDDGHLPLSDLLTKLREDRYNGAVSIEGDPEAFAHHTERAARTELTRALSFCAAHLYEQEEPPREEK